MTEARRFWQFASVVVDDVKESYTFNLCQQCFYERLTAQGLAPLKSWQWKAVVEKNAHRGRLKNVGKGPVYTKMWEYFSCKSESEDFFSVMLGKKSRKGYKAYGNKSLFSKNIWNK